jgi:glutamyl/glutaminyl-tRNA synthetase
MNAVFCGQLPLNTLYEKVGSFWPESAKTFEETYKKQVLGLVQERLKYFAELPELTDFFFRDLPINLALISEHKQLSKLDKSIISKLLQTSRDSLGNTAFTTEALSELLNKLLEQTEQKPVILFSLIRSATTQAPNSPGLAETLAVLGKEKSLQRLDETIAAWK